MQNDIAHLGSMKFWG